MVSPAHQGSVMRFQLFYHLVTAGGANSPVGNGSDLGGQGDSGREPLASQVGGIPGFSQGGGSGGRKERKREGREGEGERKNRE